jgi:predicted transcriptional regulator
MTLVKLDAYVALLETVANQGTINPAQMASLSSIEPNKLTLALAFLQSQGCLSVETSDGKDFPCYSITERGLRILKFFNYRI